MSDEISRESVLRELAGLAFGSCNDAAKLAFFQKEDAARIGRLDLRLLDGIRTTSGGVDVKLLDRAKLIELLLAATEGSGAGGGLLAALDAAAGTLRPSTEEAVAPLDP